ncbi:hypothetical protein KGQ19_01500 [Catenulispora sp. NL8]|uniref:Uncharacterized protein n=1 Tax=Catenulispora pinistramenti TaxID=2705254 RepID=A0ABS5KGU5_9ACTN|nr:hypothetical protein [Catenulispora pinistramenti]MBS2545536.1 hypothetical protein [Catenulispora pinistramenti]
MGYRWGWIQIRWRYPKYGRGPYFYAHQESFESPQLARWSLQAHLDRYDVASAEGIGASWLRTAPDAAVEIFVFCPPTAWIVFSIPDGVSIDQAAYLHRHPGSWIWNYLRSDVQQTNQIFCNYQINSGASSTSNYSGTSSSTSASGCLQALVFALGNGGVLASAWTHSRWGI